MSFFYRFVVPLFEPLIRGMVGWGGRLRTRGGSEGWYVDSNFIEEFAWAFETEIAAHVEAISTGEDFKVYIEKKLDFTSWRDSASRWDACIWANWRRPKTFCKSL